ncbi:GSCOCG00012367001-RA-CDS, partial [Cotesia congregata]
MTNIFNESGNNNHLCVLLEDLEMLEDPRTASLRRVSYGIVLPTICCLGIIGNIFNLIVLTRKNMRGTAYIYMRGYSAAALLAILFCVPFASRVLIHKETGRWNNWPQAFYHAHLELFLGNGCLGVGVMMLLALTVERYVSVCHPGQHPRPLCGPPHLVVTLIPMVTFLVYLPNVFRGEITTCLVSFGGSLIYQKRDNSTFMHSIFYQIYKVVLEVVFKVAPIILLAGFNLRIMIVYRKSCERRRRMTLSRTMHSGDEDLRTFSEERRLILLLSSTSILFLVCVSPMVILNVTLSDSNLTLYPYQV